MCAPRKSADSSYVVAIGNLVRVSEDEVQGPHQNRDRWCWWGAGMPWDQRARSRVHFVGHGWTQMMFLDCGILGSGCDCGRPMVCTSMDVTTCRRKFVAKISSSRSPSERHWKLGKMITSSSPWRSDVFFVSVDV